MHNNLFQEQTKSYFLKFGQEIHKFEETQKSIQDVFEDVYCPTGPIEKRVRLSINKISDFYACKKEKTCSHVLKNPFEDQKPTIMLFGGDGMIALQEKPVVTTKKRNHFHFWDVSPPITIQHTRT